MWAGCGRDREGGRTKGVRGAAALGVLAAAVYLWTAPGRIEFPDDEIVFQTAASLWDDGDLDIPGIAKRTGEPEGRAAGTFGWAPGQHGERYGFFGHGLSLVALPAYALGQATAEVVPSTWPHAVRSDHFVFHRRSDRADWLRLVVSLSNCVVTAVTGWLLVRWLHLLGFAGRTALWTGLGFAFATAAWAYTRTLLSEPLSGLCLLAAAYCVTRERSGGGRWLALAGAIAGFSLHVHVLNVVFLPCLLGYAWARGHGRAGLGAVALLGVGVGLLLLGQFLRFGDPLETGRFGVYSEVVAPWEGLVALAVAPGRGFFWYSPAVLLGLVGWPALRRRMPAEFWLAVGAVGLRWLVISTRSDWFGGWGLGARHLVPVIPVAMLGFAAAIEALPGWRAGARRAWWGALAGGVLLSAYLAVHSIFEWMWILMRSPRLAGRGLMHVSHWEVWASPIVGFSQMKADVLALGAVLLWRHGHPGLLTVFVGVALVGAAAGWRVWGAFTRMGASGDGLQGR